jgi:hypothetical protein
VNVVVISQSEFNTLKSIGEFKDMSQVEKLRRRKIGKANAGKVPWNKGGKHSKETIEKIRATTLKHMANPEYRERLKKSYSGNNARHSEHTRAKIKRASVDRARAKKIERLEEESSTVWGRKVGNNGACIVWFVLSQKLGGDDGSLWRQRRRGYGATSPASQG